MKKNETPEETLARLARDAREGSEATERFAEMVKRAAETPSPAAKPKEPDSEET